ncbi:helix-turn-helix transcriptional regulator [Nostoc sp. LPT]|uniref:helix-turn-helix domain-containing protein n=1 Tax=Nostoc sp. LPT TaxID=2815387 RepID=UPI001D35ECE1|nr:helix-turn-helix transcriptional regulator [Nostoc sp. LPT]MBN4002654.1 helix-turn-helix transcriptional regulator [Nostoc sp. LPT]
MGKAGEALKQVLATYGISQNKLAVTIGIRRWDVDRWVHGLTDPTGETIVEIAKALRGLNSDAALEFVKLYLGDIVHGREDPQNLEED